MTPATMHVAVVVSVGLLSISCGGPEDAADAPPSPTAVALSPSPSSTRPSAPRAGIDPDGRWRLRPSDGGVTLTFLRGDDSPAIRLICLPEENRLVVNVPGFRPIGSEERLSVGGDGVAIALVADTRGDAERGGVSGTGEVPGNLAVLVNGRLSASYGAQNSGSHSAPPQQLSRAFVAACSRRSVAQSRALPVPAKSIGACLMKGSERLRVTPRRAVGTEPFWAAQIEGRCVNYSHPEDHKGTRVWTRYTQGPDGETWSGELGERLFELRIRDAPGCSDGMSDKRYPMAVELKVRGELRRGCAEPA